MDQMTELDKHKWIEGEKRHCDPGQPCIIEWVTKYAAKFREEWEQKNGKLTDGISCNCGSGRYPRSE